MATKIPAVLRNSIKEVARVKRVRSPKAPRPSKEERTLAVMGSRIHVQGQPWEQQWGESKRAFEAFVLFRDMGTARTKIDVAKTISQSPSQHKRVYIWASKWCWDSRVLAWDRHLDKIGQEQHEREAKIMGRRQAALGTKMQIVAETRLDQYAGSAELQASMGIGDVVRLAEAGAKIERSSYSDLDKSGGDIVFNIGMMPSWAGGSGSGSEKSKAIGGGETPVLEGEIVGSGDLPGEEQPHA